MPRSSVDLNKSVFTFDDLSDWMARGRPVAPEIKFAVIGDPVAHSASPPMHNAALESCGLPSRYIRLHIRPGELKAAFEQVRQLGFHGINLTIPHKAAVLPLLDSVDPDAAQIGVVNTVRFDDGAATGFNTDGPGLVRAIREVFHRELRDCRVMITGAGGGAGRATAIQCALEGCPQIILVNRTLSKVAALEQELDRVSSALNSHTRPKILSADGGETSLAGHMSEVDLVLQCSSLGMAEGDASPIPASALHSGVCVYDTIYSRKTRLLTDAEAVGARVANGLSMLLHQGALAFEIWLKRPAPLAVMKSALFSAVNQ